MKYIYITDRISHIYLCIYNFILLIFGCAGSSLLCAGSVVTVVSGNNSSLRCTGLLLQWLLSLQSTGSRCMGFSSFSSWALAALKLVESFQTRDRTRVPSVGRQILSHCTTREVLEYFLKTGLFLHVFSKYSFVWLCGTWSLLL